ncbi:hypothetical protein [Streptomyces sp. A13(2022)]|uniref:hypothetical protein n=1 Tax=Streptomyces sp. A13(2022) TaxID=2964768 RepID=UPI0021D94988|nr:hypothetical protein [Streptomyces sp. A13(2022)]MCU8593772.1 hypothetical protein [Streptomyces sp. A13(2022)]
MLFHGDPCTPWPEREGLATSDTRATGLQSPRELAGRSYKNNTVMTDLPFSSEPELRPHKITRKNADELLRRVNQRFRPDEVWISTRYPIPRAQRGADDNPCVSARARTLDDLLNDHRITRVVPGGTDVVLTNLTVEATHPDRKIRVKMTHDGVDTLIECTDQDWVHGRCDDVRHALESNHPSWALWRPSRRRGFLGLGLALDAVAAAAGWIIAGTHLLHLGPALVMLAVLITTPTLCSLLGHRFAHRGHVRIAHTDPTWFWQRWTVSEKLALAAVLVAILALATQHLTSTNSTEGHHQPSRAPNTAVGRELP